MDMKWPEMPSKVNFGHPIWPIDQKWPEMRHPKCDLQNGRRRPFCQKFKKIIKICMDLKWPEMPSKVIFGHPKWPPKKTNKLRSSNLTHALFIQISRTSSITDIVAQSKMAAGGHFVKKLKKKFRTDLKWQEL